MWWNNTIEFVSDLNEIATFLAFLVGLLWVGYKARIYRAWRPKLNIKHNAHLLNKTKDGCILWIDIQFTNASNILITDLEGYIWLNNLDEVSQDNLSPIKKGAASNPNNFGLNLKDFRYVPSRLEPGETDAAYTLVHIHMTPQKIEFYSHIRNADYRGIWPYSSKKGDTDNGKKQANSFGWNNYSLINLSETNPSDMSEEEKKPDKNKKSGNQAIQDKPLPEGQGEAEQGAPTKDDSRPKN